MNINEYANIVPNLVNLDKIFLNVKTKQISRQVEVNISTGEDIEGTEEYYGGQTDGNSTVDSTGGGVTPVDTTVTAGGEQIITGATVIETTPTKTSGSDALEPYIYIIKEEKRDNAKINC